MESPRVGQIEGSLHRVASREGTMQDSTLRMSMPDTILESGGDGGDAAARNLSQSLRNATAALQSGLGTGSLRLPTSGVPDGMLPGGQAPGGSIKMGVSGGRGQQMNPSPRTSSAARQLPPGRTLSIDAQQRSNSINRGTSQGSSAMPVGSPPAGASSAAPVSKTAVRGSSFQAPRVANASPPPGTTVATGMGSPMSRSAQSTPVSVASPTTATRTKLYQGVVNSTPAPQPRR